MSNNNIKGFFWPRKWLLKKSDLYTSFLVAGMTEKTIQ